jgi:hypothetical protein
MVAVTDRWSLFGGGRYSEVVVSSGLTVPEKKEFLLIAQEMLKIQL